MALFRNKKPVTARRKNKPAASGRGSWFELIVFFLMAFAVYLMGTLMDSSWTGVRGRLLGQTLRGIWGGALLVPLLFLFYLCIAWFAKTKIPRPLGQIMGTLQLYLTAVFTLGLLKQAQWDLSWVLGSLKEPGSVGDGLAQFFVLNLGVLGTILVAFASLALSAILFGFKLPVRLLQAFALRFMEGKVNEREVREDIRADQYKNAQPAVTIRPLPKAGMDDLPMPAPKLFEPHSTPLDGLVVMGDELIDSTDYHPSEPIASEAESELPISAERITPVLSENDFKPPFPEPTEKEPVFKEKEEIAQVKVEPAAESVPKEKPRTAAEILEGLLASLEAEESVVPVTKIPISESTYSPKPPETPEPERIEPGPETLERKEYKAPLLSKADLDPAQIIEVESAAKPSPEEQVLELKELLSHSEKAAAKTLLLDGKGLASAVQETFPEVEFAEDEDVGRIRAGLFPPPLDLFGPTVKNEDEDSACDLANEQADVIVSTLQNFGVKASVAHIVIGPSVIQFQLELAPGIKVSKVSGLANDLTMALAVVSVRVEAPILGQRYVGIEIPNPKRKGITLRSIMESEEFQQGEALLPLPMGVRVDSKHLICGLEDMPHLLVAGTTGSGKSVFMNSCILGMCSQRSPEQLKLILVDPKHVEFAIYEGLPHLLALPVSDPKKAIFALSWAVQEMERRSECFARVKVRNLASYNEKTLPKHRFPHIVVVVDELADLMYTAGKEVEGLIARLAQKARAAGIHLILATQRPSVDVITGLIKANVPARVAFAVPSQTDSRTIIDTGGAEKLLGKGDMLFYSTRYPRPLRLQAAFITEERTLAFVEYMKNAFGEPEYIEFEDPGNGGGSPENGGRSGSSVIDDPKLDEAIKVVMDTGIASASGLQRYLNIGYPRAGRMVTGLEQLGIVGQQPANSSKPREILMDEESAFEALERARNGDPFAE